MIHNILTISSTFVYTIYMEVIAMSAMISKWENRHGIYLSQQADKSIVLRQVPKTKATRFMELFGNYKEDWKCCEAETGPAVGNEATLGE